VSAPRWTLQDSSNPTVLFRLAQGGVKTIGREAKADFILSAPLVSRIHCRLTADASDQLVVEDLDSENGTFVNGRKVERATLKPGDRLTVGRVDLTVSSS
jgi:pSer/pThr/pTyr-binding forkhead associated (FHA) protein